MAAKLLVIGGDAAGMSAAAQARRADPQLEIVVLEKGPYISYSMCGEPYYVGNVVPYFEDLIVYTPEYFRAERGIDVRTHHEAIGLDTGAHQVEVLDRMTGERTQEPYDRLIIATGARPSIPSIPGVDSPNVFCLRGLDDTIAIKEAVNREDVRQAVIVGSGYIGMEMAEAFSLNGLAVTIVEAGETLMCGVSPRCGYDPAIGHRLAEMLEEHGVDVHTGEAARGFSSDPMGGVSEVCTDRRTLQADIVLLATGVRPNSALAAAAGLALGVEGAIRVDARMATSAPDVFAAGDCAEHFHRVTRKPGYVPLGVTAVRQGYVAGTNVCGGDARFAGVLGTAATKIFELEIARTGLAEGEAKQAGFDAVVADSQSASHSGYIPGGEDLSTHLIVERSTRRLLGAQIIGREGAATRIDVFAAVLAAGMSVDTIGDLDLAYAPTLAPLWDPILRAARDVNKVLAAR